MMFLNFSPLIIICRSNGGVTKIFHVIRRRRDHQLLFNVGGEERLQGKSLENSKRSVPVILLFMVSNTESQL